MTARIDIDVERLASDNRFGELMRLQKHSDKLRQGAERSARTFIKFAREINNALGKSYEGEGKLDDTLEEILEALEAMSGSMRVVTVAIDDAVTKEVDQAEDDDGAKAKARKWSDKHGYRSEEIMESFRNPHWTS